MRFHDFHLTGYSVRKFGGEIVLHLVYDYPPKPPEESHIRFDDVVFYHFVHTSSAIITGIDEIPLSKFVTLFVERLAKWGRQYGVSLWDGDPSRYQVALESESVRAWEISSAVGYAGVVVAKRVEDVTQEYSQPPHKAPEPTTGSRSGRGDL